MASVRNSDDLAKWWRKRNITILLREVHLFHDHQRCRTCQYLATGHGGLDGEQVQTLRRLHRRLILVEAFARMRTKRVDLAFLPLLPCICILCITAIQLPWHGYARQLGAISIAFTPAYVRALRNAARHALGSGLLWRAFPIRMIAATVYDIAFWGGLPVGVLWWMRTADHHVDFLHTLGWFFPSAALAAIFVEVAERRVAAAVARRTDSLGWTVSRSQAAARKLLSLSVGLQDMSRTPHRTSVQRFSNVIASYGQDFKANFATVTTPPLAARRSQQFAQSRQLGMRIAVALDQASQQMLDTATAKQREEIISRIHTLMASALAGDWSGLPEVAPTNWRTRLRERIRRILPPLTLGSFAITLPHLPGVDQHASSVTGIQVGLLLGAVLTLIGATPETRSAVLDAYQKAEPDRGS
ncbi:hypothetical protein Caci_8951 [Catenulispora acidiphila DSM 44928]|uniref:Uncharacterized protein n=1 Tax=Catenulispora acidiphila (strain DSM 44928 / JCM 14897 / NBRC 102108 / NRRL B-24433 / ID139908) TaxID=479433 RepID=C7Q406_CATAD|nr:hypothetical protein [Catenulispora acidiphila]ACU77764.1 hypothetical protein Caci_8951 [Catenulispora acidiphila DSM 44928]